MDCETVDCAAGGVSMNFSYLFPITRIGENIGSLFFKSVIKQYSRCPLKKFLLAKSFLLSTLAIKRSFPIADSVQVMEDKNNSPRSVQKYNKSISEINMRLLQSYMDNWTGYLLKSQPFFCTRFSYFNGRLLAFAIKQKTDSPTFPL